MEQLGSQFRVETPRFAEFFAEHSSLVADLARFDRSRLAAILGGLLTMPGWQASIFRLEVLQHLVVWTAAGSKRVTTAHLESWLRQLGDGMAGRMEDPAEEIFVSRVLSRSRDFLVLNGMHEASAFCLQRFVNIVATMPERGPFTQLRRSVYALLQLSDSVAERAGLTAHLVGEMIPLKIVPEHLLEGLQELSKRVSFSTSELRALGIDPNDLTAFILDHHAVAKIDDQHLGGSTLERFPLLRTKHGVIVALPTAVSMAIRRLIVEISADAGVASALYDAFARDVAQTLSAAPLLGSLHLPPLPFELKNDLFVGNAAGLIDEGRLLHFCFVVDDFAAYDNTGTSSAHPDSSRLGALVDDSIRQVRESFDNPTIREVVTLVVMCAWGRPIALHHEGVNDSRWRFEHISAADLEVVSWAIKFKPLDLWRLLDARDRLREMGVVLVNVNGLLNLYAWSLELDGDLVPHDRLPGDFDPRETLHVVISQNSLLRVRKQVADGWNVHHATMWTGQRTLVRRQQPGSYFDEFLVEPAYISMDDFAAGRLVALFATRDRTWWTAVDTPNTDDRSMQYRLWHAVSSWMGKAAPVLERELPQLPTKPVAWICRFEDSADEEPAGVDLDRATARAFLRVEIHDAAIHVTAGRGFLHLFRKPTNLAESLLVESLVEGSLRLAGADCTQHRIRDLLNLIVPNEWAREVHLFEVRKFRHAVAGAAERELTLTTKHDDAFIRLGLGWRTRNRQLGPIVEGIKECCDFLNSMVEEIWMQTRTALQAHNREWLLVRLLKNHESIVLSTDNWFNTARAITFLNGDPRLTEFQAATRIMELNGGVVASRILAEMALCECPDDGGTHAGDLDITRLLACALHMYRLGGWSEAIKYETKEAAITISPLGDVHTNGEFDNEIAGPYSLSLGVKKFRSSAQAYDEQFDLSDPPHSVEHLFEPEFWAAWLEAYGFTVDELRIFLDSLDNEGVRRQALVFVATDSEIRALSGMETIGHATLSRIFHALTLCPRKSWDSTPDGFSPKDWYPWRYRRRLSLISRPILRLNGGDEQRYLVAPAMIRDGVAKVLEYCFRGGYEAKSFPPGRMRSWIGAAENERGHRFNQEVASRLREVGWNTRTDIKLTEILNDKLDRDYGDVDVLAWRDERILAIECKDLELAMTVSEIAHQLNDFRGRTTANGKPDRLKRHLMRTEVLKRRMPDVARFTKMSGSATVETCLIFSDAVPMTFVRDAVPAVRIVLFEEIPDL